MITLYKVQRSVKEVEYISSVSGMKYKTLINAENYTPINFPDNIFTYYGWEPDYVRKRVYRYRGTDLQQEFLLDKALLSVSAANYISPDEWMSHSGNYIELVKFGKMCKWWDKIPVGTQQEIISKMNPSNADDNIWLMSYMQGDVEVYLYQFYYDKVDDIVRMESVLPRKDTERMPGPDNIQTDDNTSVQIESDSPENDEHTVVQNEGDNVTENNDDNDNGNGDSQSSDPID